MSCFKIIESNLNRRALKLAQKGPVMQVGKCLGRYLILFLGLTETCLAASKQDIWTTSIILENLTGEKIVCTIPKFQKKGFLIENASLEPFQSSGFVSIETDKQPSSPILIKWQTKGRSYSQKIIFNFPLQVRKNPKKLDSIRFNFEEKKCFISYDIQDSNFLFNESQILADGTPINHENLKMKNGFKTKKLRNMRIKTDDEEDKHYQLGWLIIPQITGEENEIECFVEIDLVCKKIYVENKNALDKLGKYQKENTVCYYGILPFLKKK